MLAGEGSARAQPPLEMLAAAGARIEGLRLGDGGLVLKWRTTAWRCRSALRTTAF